MAKKVLVVEQWGRHSSYYNPFYKFGEQICDVSILDKNPQDVALAVFTGGEDCHPSIYGEESNGKTYANIARDKFEIGVFKELRELNIPIAGICRGAQFICAMSGGKLVQHLDNHGSYHDVETDDGRIFNVSSTHHQNQIPPKDALPLAWAAEKRSDVYEGPNGVFYNLEKEWDVVYYPNINAIGFQYHPEFMDEKSEGFLYVEELVDRFFKLEKIKG